MNAYQKFNQLAGQVTGEVIAQLEQGSVLWRRPWTSHGLPRNHVSGRRYEGFNAFYLNHVTESNNYTAPCFLTFKQAQELGGHVRKGEKGTPVIYWKIREEKAGEGTPEQAEGDSGTHGRKFVPFLWSVFNIDQVEGIDFTPPEAGERTAWQVLEACERVAGNYPVPRPLVRHGGSRAFYAPASDRVQLPDPKSFVSPQAYHATLFHELIHSTGHPHRLNRFTEEERASRFGDDSYSKEELIAEMGASFLCAFTGIQEEVFGNSVAYLQGWADRFRGDKTMLIYASARAFRAAAFILDLQAEENRGASPAVAA